MNATILILIFLLVAGAYVYNRRKRKPLTVDSSTFLEHRRFEGLFAEQLATDSKLLAEAEAKLRAQERRQFLLERAAAGDETVLDDAHENGDDKFYYEVLQTLVAQADGDDETLRSMAEYIVDSGQLRSSSDFAETMIEVWSKSLNQRSLTDMLYLAALADEPVTFQHAVEVALRQWREGKLSCISVKDIFATVESAYWLVASEVRYSGSGFFLKQAIANVRRELAAANTRSA